MRVLWSSEEMRGESILGACIPSNQNSEVSDGSKFEAYVVRTILVRLLWRAGRYEREHVLRWIQYCRVMQGELGVV